MDDNQGVAKALVAHKAEALIIIRERNRVEVHVHLACQAGNYIISAGGGCGATPFNNQPTGEWMETLILSSLNFALSSTYISTPQNTQITLLLLFNNNSVGEVVPKLELDVPQYLARPKVMTSWKARYD